LSQAFSTFDAGNYAATVKFLSQALQIAPNRYDVLAFRGFALDCLGQYEAGVESYDRALQINPNDQGTWFNRANALKKLGRYEEAIASLKSINILIFDLQDVWQ
jgi:tetratricopeptide (TPR) repeat protein